MSPVAHPTTAPASPATGAGGLIMRITVHQDTYVDSVIQLSGTRAMRQVDGVVWAAAAMATPANLGTLAAEGFELAAVSSAAYIPQVGRVGSLNVAVAAAIALAEARRREWTSPPD